ncbi:MAG TPA: DUF58 domain-containing protein [Pseudonocardiaceae bacterium]
MRRPLSGLTTRGRCLLAAGVAAALCALVLDERDLLRVALFAAALPLLATALVSGSRVGLTAVRNLVPDRIPVGTRGDVELVLRSDGRIPAGGLLLEDDLPYALGSRPRFVVARLPRHQAVRLTYPLHPVMRGVHRIGPLTTRITDPFGLAEAEGKLTEPSRLVVVPQVVRLYGLPSTSGLGAGDDGSVRLRTGQGEDDAVVRPYRHGDDIRKVHWRSTARRDELMVRVEERPWRGGTTVLLDHRSAAHRGDGPTSSLEWAVSLAASVCLHLHRHGHSVRLVTEDGRLLARGGPESGTSAAVLDALAGLQASHRRDLVHATDPAAGNDVIAILGAASPTAVGELVRHRSRAGRSLAVLLDVAAWATAEEESVPDPHEAARLLRGAGWRVAVAGPNRSMAEVWAELCGTSIATSTGGAW